MMIIASYAKERGEGATTNVVRCHALLYRRGTTGGVAAPDHVMRCGGLSGAVAPHRTTHGTGSCHPLPWGIRCHGAAPDDPWHRIT